MKTSSTQARKPHIVWSQSGEHPVISCLNCGAKKVAVYKTINQAIGLNNLFQKEHGRCKKRKDM